MDYKGFQLQVSRTPEGKSTSLRNTQSVSSFFQLFQYKLGATLYIAIHSIKKSKFKQITKTLHEL